MKRSEFIKEIENAGCFLIRHGSNHDIFYNPLNGNKQPVPRHNEIDNQLAKHIKKKPGILEIRK